jgi:Protein of unknown function (DUF3467)
MASDPTQGAERLVYANWSRYLAGPFDLSLDFGYNTQEGGPPDSFPVRVVLPWEHVKILAQFLEQAIKAYEDQAGEIRDLEDGGTVSRVDTSSDS